MTRTILYAILLSTVAGLSACAGTGNDERPEEPVTKIPFNERAEGDTHRGEGARPDLRAVAVLAEHLSVPPEEIHVAIVQGVVWPDTSLGCPQPGMSYNQVLVPGQLAVLVHEGRKWHVHMGEGRAFVCESTGKRDGGGNEPRPLAVLSREQLESRAAADLARRLGAPPDSVSVVETEGVQWADSSLGCPAPGGDYQAVTTKGFVLTLSHDGRRYKYHADRYRVFPCPSIESR